MTKVLYIEDNESNVLLVKKILEASGFEVSISNTGYDGLKLARDIMPDIILIDINLPDIDGYTITSVLKGNESLKDIPIVALTANAIDGERERSIIAGCNGYIEKPIDIDTFVNRINCYLGGQKEQIDNINLRDKFLKEYNAKLSGKLAYYIEKSHEFSETEAELDITKTLQRMLLPQSIPVIKNYDVKYTYIPAKSLAGDYLDIIELVNDYLFILFDVAGHGVSSALVMTIIQSLIHSRIDKLEDPFYIINFVNNVLTSELMKQKYVVGSILYLNKKTDLFSFFRLGAMPLIVYKAKTKKFESLMPSGGFLGAFDTETVYKQLSSEQFYLNVNDIIVLYTDGLVDLHFEKNDFFGGKRLKQIIYENHDMQSAQIALAINDAVIRFTKGRMRNDDISFTIIKKIS